MVSNGSKRVKKCLPCIWPIINSLSNRSVPASNNSFPPRASRNFRLKPTNQFSQKGFVAERFVRHNQGRAVSVGSLSSYKSDGTEARADVVLRIVRERVLHGEHKKGKSELGTHTAIQSLMIMMGTGLVVLRGTFPCFGERPLRILGNLVSIYQ